MGEEVKLADLYEKAMNAKTFGEVGSRLATIAKVGFEFEVRAPKAGAEAKAIAAKASVAEPAVAEVKATKVEKSKSVKAETKPAKKRVAKK